MMARILMTLGLLSLVEPLFFLEKRRVVYIERFVPAPARCTCAADPEPEAAK